MRAVCVVAVLLAVSALAACNYGTAVFFKQPYTGQIEVCGPYPHKDTAAADEQICFAKAAAEGFVRTKN
jgi:hypothetical protein